MPTGPLPPLSPEPAHLSPLFEPDCASCGKGRLRTVASKNRSANAGFCPSCGVFVCFKCAGATGWLNWKKLCPSCGRRLRTNTLLWFGTVFGLVLILLAFGLVWAGAGLIQLGIDERAQMEMPESDLGMAAFGSTVKVSGTVAGSREVPVGVTLVSEGEHERIIWDTYDFDLNTTAGKVRVRGSLLSDIGASSRRIIGSDGYRGAYRIGDRMVVLGTLRGNRTGPVIEPERLAPTNGSLYSSADRTGWTAMGFGSLGLLLAPLVTWAFFARYRSHRRRVWDFGLDASVKPLSSIEGLGAGLMSRPAPRSPPTQDGNDALEAERTILNVEALLKELENRRIEAPEPANLLRLAASFARAKNHSKALRYAKMAEEKAQELLK